jgi:N-acyl-D-aspartate/D-glutamate deacylase
MTSYDLVIRGACIYDGGGSAPFEADIGIIGDRIVCVGVLSGSTKREIDARGLIATPGFVDIHTHYDCQVTWDERLRPSSDHGVTTVVMGNCAVGVAPCRPGDRGLLQHVIAGVEDIPETVMTEGLAWDWETFPEYMEMLAGRTADVDFAAQIPHSALRVYVMGKRGAEREPATAADLAAMSALVREGLQVGALGVSTSHTLAHRTPTGSLAPAETAAEEELLALARPLEEVGHGVFQLMIDFHDLSDEGSSTFDMLTRVAKAAGRPLSYLLAQFNHIPEGWRTLLDLTARANAQGIDIKAQVAPRGIGVMLGLDLSLNPFSLRPTYRSIEHLPLAERVMRMREPAIRAAILGETNGDAHPNTTILLASLENLAPLGSSPDYEPAPEKFLGYRAAAEGRTIEEIAYELLLEDEGRAILYQPFGNYAYKSLDAVLEMMLHPYSLVALGDGGAHCGLISDAAYPTYMLTHWVQSRTRGARVELRWAIKALTSEPAAALGLHDRGLIKPGYKADLNIIDLAAMRLHAPEVTYDLPGGGRRIRQTADGYRFTIVSGTVTYQDGQPTGVLPGRLVRGPQSAPREMATA